MFENYSKSVIQNGDRSELRLQKLIKNARNVVFLRVFHTYKLTVKQYYQRILMGQKLVENVKIEM